jgi:hypothetical protein
MSILAIRVFANNKPAEIAVIERPVKLTRLQWNRFEIIFINY